MNGTYTIGSSLSDNFSSFSEAIDSLESQGISGSVLIQVKAGTYAEQVVIHEIPGASLANRITFESFDKDSASVNLTHSPTSGYANFTLHLSGADFITFKHISITSGGTTYARVIQLEAMANFNEFISNQIIGRAPPIKNIAFSSDLALVYSSNAYNGNDHNNLFKNNLFKHGLVALDYHGSNLSDEKGTIIIDNYFLNQYSSAIYLSNQKDVIIHNNYIFNNRYDYFTGIFLNLCHGNFQLSSNKINIPFCFSGFGINIDNCKGDSTNKALIANNFIRVNAVDSVNVYNYNQAALQLAFAENINAFHNSIHLTGDYYLSTAVLISPISNFTSLINNNVVNSAGGVCLEIIDPWDSMNIELNYNNYFSSSHSIRYNDSLYLTNEWIANTKYDQSSISFDPDFISKSDLHTHSIYLNNKGIKLALVTNDIDNTVRDSLAPDIGADEFSPLSNDQDIQLLYPNKNSNCHLSDSQHVSILIINKGLQSCSKLFVHFKLPGIDSFTEMITDTIISLDSFYYTSTSFFDLSQNGFSTLEISMIDSFDQNERNNLIHAVMHNLHPIQSFPFMEDFEKSYTDYFNLTHESEARISIDNRAAYRGNFGMHSQGRSQNIGWVGGGNSTNTYQAWHNNWRHFTQATSCIIDAKNQTYLRLCFRMRMTYSYGLKSNWFRILANDSIQLSDMNGISDFNPNSNKDTFELLYFDLSSFCGDEFKIAFQTSSQVLDKYYNEGDNVFIDDIQIFVPPESDVGVVELQSPIKPHCGEVNSPVVAVIKNFGYASQTHIPVFAEVQAPWGKIILRDTFHRILAANTTDTINLGFINTKTEGDYFFKFYTAFNEDSICRQNDTFQYAITFINPLELPIMESFEGADSLKNWNTKNMWVSYPGAHNVNSWTLSNSIWAIDSVAIASFKRKIGPISDKSNLLFQYRIVHNEYPFAAMTIGAYDSLIILASANCGSNYDTLLIVDSINHIATDEMRQIQLPVSKYSGSYLNLKFKIVSENLNRNYFDLDSIVVADLPKIPNIRDTVACAGDSVTITISPQLNQFYYWQNINKNDTLSNSNQLTLIDSGIYMLTISDTFGWKNRDTFNFRFHPIPSTFAGNDTAVCLNDTIRLSGTGGNSFYWSTGDSTQILQLVCSKSQMLILTSQSPEGCRNTDSVFISALQLPYAEAGSDTFCCLAEKISLSAFGGIQYVWITGDSSKTIDFTASISQFISVQVFNASGCSSSDSLKLEVYSLPYVFAGNDTAICKNQPINLNANGNLNYIWSNGDSSAQTVVQINNNSSIWLMGTDSNNCSNFDTIEIQAKELPIIDLGNDTSICINQSIQLYANPNVDSWLWSTGDTSSSITIDSSNIPADSIGIWIEVSLNTCTNYDTIRVGLDSCLSIPNAHFENNLTVYPNPAQEWIHLYLPVNLSAGEIGISLLDLNGKIHIFKKIQIPYNETTVKLRLTNIAAGVYFLHIQDQSNFYYTKVLIH